MSADLTKTLVIRAAKPRELPFIKHSWFKSFRPHSGVRPDVYAPGMNRRIDRLCGMPGLTIIVAVLEAAPDEILGWVVRDTSTIHFVYTKQAYRRAKVATALIIGAQTYTTSTPAGVGLFHATGAVYNPFLLEL